MMLQFASSPRLRSSGISERRISATPPPYGVALRCKTAHALQRFGERKQRVDRPWWGVVLVRADALIANVDDLEQSQPPLARVDRPVRAAAASRIGSRTTLHARYRTFHFVAIGNSLRPSAVVDVERVGCRLRALPRTASPFCHNHRAPVHRATCRTQRTGAGVSSSSASDR